MREEKVSIDNTYINVIRFGRGDRNLVILPGISLVELEGIGKVIENAYQLFAEKYTVYLLERKKDLPEGYSTEEMAEDAYSVLTGLGVEKTSIYGVSHGGMMAIYIAGKHPDFVEKLVLCSTCMKNTEMMDSNFKCWYDLASKHDVQSLNRDFFKKIYSDSFLKENEKALKAAERFGNAENCERFKVLLKACKDFDATQVVKSIECPALVLGDENDRVTGAQGSRELAEALDCQIYMYTDFGHAVYDESPDIKNKVFEFLG